jgi:hypothetical protein
LAKPVPVRYGCRRIAMTKHAPSAKTHRLGPPSLALLLGAFGGCGDCADCGQRADAPAARLEPLAQQAPPAPPPDPQPAARPATPRPGWSKVSLHDAVPICVFPGYAERELAPFVEQVQPHKLPAKSSVVFGAFAPWCVNEACDDLPSLQCAAELDGKTITVTTHYWGEHKDGASCTETCRRITAGCQTPELPAGSYSVRYAGSAFELRIPSTPRAPCFGTEQLTAEPPAGVPSEHDG